MSKAIGIDLGTTNTVVSVVIDGKPVVIKTSEGIDHIPSVVCYDTKYTNDWLVGQQAKGMAADQPGNVVYSVKRLMGLLHYGEFESRTQEEQKEYERFLEIKEKVGYRLAPDPQGKDDGVRILLGGDVCRTPVEISAMILRRAREDAEKFLGHPVSKAVITVPAYFEAKQIDATKRAGEMAGLDVLRILEEPSAAAIAAAHGRQKKSQHILVYDLGGGTFDVSVLHVNDDKFRVRALGGDNWLGGDNFDDELTSLVAAHIAQTHGYDPTGDREFRARIKPVSEEAKITLSTEDHAMINAPNCCTAPVGDGSRRRLVSVRDLAVTRAEYARRILPFVDKTITEVERILKKGEITAANIDEVILVGGATYTPCVRQAIEAQFPGGKVRPVEEAHPMHAVAQGAAILAEKLAGQPEGTVIGAGGQDPIVNASPMSIGIASRDGHKVDVFSPIIPAGTRLPMKEPMSQLYHAARSDLIRIAIYQGESKQASKNRFQGNIGLDLSLKERPERHPVAIGTPITVGLRLTEDRIIEVTVQIQGREKIVTELVYDSRMNSEWKEELEHASHIARMFVSEYAPYVTSATAGEIQSLIERGSQALDDENRIEGKSVAAKLTRLCVYQDQLGNVLFKAEHLQRNPALPDTTRAQLGAWCQAAKNAHHGDRERSDEQSRLDLSQCKEHLEVLIAMCIRQLPRDNDGTPDITEARM